MVKNMDQYKGYDEIAMFEEIINNDTWCKIEKINKGWSDDTKYYIETTDNQKLVLRTSNIGNYKLKKREYQIVCKYSSLGFKMSEPVSFGVCNKNQNVYILLT